MRGFFYVAAFFICLSVIGLWVYSTSVPSADDRVAEVFKEFSMQRQRAAGNEKDARKGLGRSAEKLVADFESSRKNATSAEERAELARELNIAYYESRSEILQKKIAEALTRALREEENPEVARAIALSHSRLPYDENTLPNLKMAYERKVMDFDGYYGELSRAYGDAPEKIRKDVIKEIADSNSRYAVDVIAGQLAFDDNIQLSQEEIVDLQRLFTINEPIFVGAEDAFGYFDAINYVDWLFAYARLQKAAGGVSLERFWGEKLLDPKTDPRAAVSFLATGHAGNLTASQKAQMQWDAVQARAQEMVRQHPNAVSLQQISKEMAK